MIPPVRLLRGGREERGVWALILNNVRLADKVEMDLRSLIAGVNVADAKIRELATAYGEPTFAAVTGTVIVVPGSAAGMGGEL